MNNNEVKRFVLNPTIEAIYNTLHIENCEVSGIDGVPVDNKLMLNPGYMDLEFDSIYRAVPARSLLGNLPSLLLKTDKALFRIPHHNAHFEGSITMGSELIQHFEIRFSRLIQSTLEPANDYYWRFAFPVDENEWLLKIAALPYEDDLGSHHFHNLIKTVLDGHEMFLYGCNVNDNHWMIIESSDSIRYEEMDHRVMSMTTALGFVLGKRYGDFCFYVASVDPSFNDIAGIELLTLQKTTNCPFRILQTNCNIVFLWLQQFEYQKYALDEIRNSGSDGVRMYYQEDASVTMDAYGKLSQLCYKTNDMLLAASMLIDGCMMNIEYQKPIFHVALETITTSLLNGDGKLPPTIPQEQYNMYVAPVLIDALKNISELSEDEIRIYSNRIEKNLNTVPNNNKLEACFPKYGYELTSPDKDAIKKRNSTFHGHLASDEKLLREQQNELLSISLRLHKLCSILLLKAAGFSGKIINNEVLFGIKEACERKEHVYIDI